MGALASYKGDMEMYQKHFADMVRYMDKLVGQIVAQLEASGVRENTLLIFTGDNGTDSPIVTSWKGREIPGGKGSMMDNGTRVPLIASWPESAQSGVVSDELVDFADILPTLCEVAGIDLPEGYPGDGVSLVPVLTGDESRNRPWVYVWYSGPRDPGQIFARTREYKYLCGIDLSESRFFQAETPFAEEELKIDVLDEEQQRILEMLRSVVLEFAATRPIEAGSD